jgi:hypothetical protein
MINQQVDFSKDLAVACAIVVDCDFVPLLRLTHQTTLNRGVVHRGRRELGHGRPFG